MTTLKFCANISWLFTELPDFCQRITAAASAGFQAVEAAWLYDADLKALQAAREAAGIQVVLINTPPGKHSAACSSSCSCSSSLKLRFSPQRVIDSTDMAVSSAAAGHCNNIVCVCMCVCVCVAGNVKAGDLGLGAVPGREAEFRQGLDLAVKYAKALDCRRIHLMAGRVPVDSQRVTVAKEMEATFVQNLSYAADVLSKEGITGLIEPINTRITDPRYFLDSPHHAAAVLEKVAKPNIKLQMDVFHWQIMDGNLTQNIQNYFPLIGHVQIAQVPGRNEPDSEGELNYSYVLETLKKLGYQGFIGCEYKPLRSTQEGLGWLRDYCSH
ncbi:uncharacterized protein V6R79_021144 [Siganus canaliculatus]